MTKPDVEILPSAYGMAFPLAWVAGYVDAAGFLAVAGLFVGHMSGNTVRLGVFVGGGDWSPAAQRLVPIVVFTLGVVVGIALCEALGRRSIPVTARVLGIEAVLLLVFMLVGRAVLGSDSAPPAPGTTTSSRLSSSLPWAARTWRSRARPASRSTPPS